MAFSLIADGVCAGFRSLDAGMLARRGVRLLLADLDNTLISYSDSLPTPELHTWKEALALEGITLFVLSNSRKPDRVRRFSEALGVPYLSHAGKPGAAGFHKAMDGLGRTAADTLMAGDQVFTDVLGAKNAGVPVLLMRPIRLAGNPGRYLRYAAELPFRLLAARRKSWAQFQKGANL